MANDAQRVVGSFVSHMLTRLEAAEGASAAAAVMDEVVVLLMANSAAPSETHDATSPAARELHAHAPSEGWQALRACFYPHHYQAWASAVLSVDPGGETGMQQADLQRALERTFMEAPAAQALAALCGHLAMVGPAADGPSPGWQRGVSVEPLGTGAALRLLRMRFADPGSTGIAEVVASCAGTVAGADPHRRTEQAGGSADAEECAGHLVSLPERVQHLCSAPSELAPRAYIPQLVRCTVAAAAAGTAGCQSASDSGGAVRQERTQSHSHASTSESTSTHGTLGARGAATSPAQRAHNEEVAAFVAALFGRLVVRGHTRLMVAELLHMARKAQEEHHGRDAVLITLRGALLQLAGRPGALDRLLPELLLQVALLPAAAAAQGAVNDSASGGGRLALLQQLLPPALLADAGARYVLTEKLLLHRTLPTPALELVLTLLDSVQLLQPAAAALAAAWADPQGLPSTRLPQQAYMTQALLECLSLLPAGGFPAGAAAGATGAAVLVPALLQGVSARLGSPRPAVRAQAMRLGRALAATLDPSKPLFEDQGSLELMREELWPGARSRPQRVPPASPGPVHQSPAPPAAPGCGAAAADTPAQPGSALARLREAAAHPDSDDDDDDKGSTAGGAHAAAAAAASGDAASEADSLEPYDLAEDVEADAWEGEGQGSDGGTAAGGAGGVRAAAPLSLRPLAAALRKADDVQGVLDALARVEVLVRAMPDELPTYAPDLVRSLLHCRVPEWAEVEAQRPEDKPEGQRQRALVALMACAPLEAGDQALSEVYSPHLDMYQRVLLMDALCGAAQQLADPRCAPQLVLGAGAPQLLPPPGQAPPAACGIAGAPAAQPVAAGAHPPGAVAGDAGGAGAAEAQAGVLAAPGLREAGSRVWGPISLRKLRQRGGGGDTAAATAQRTWRNRFAPIALRWASALLRSCDERAPGVDLFGRDTLLLGRLLTALGTFVECTGEAPQALPLAVAVLELLRAPQVSGNSEPHVRRCALVAAAAVVSNLPPPRLAGALGACRRDAGDAQLVERLQWLQAWAAAAAQADADDTCRVLAAGVVGMHAELATSAMAASALLPHPPAWDPLAAPDLASKRSARSQGAALEIAVPRLDELRLA